MVADADHKVRAIIDRLGHRSMHVLCTYEFDYEDLVDTIEQSPSDWFWWVRIHPCRQQDRSTLRNLLVSKGISNYDLDDATDLPLYALLRTVDVHLTEYSSTVIEATAFGVPSVITRKAGFEAFPAQVASGWAVAAFQRQLAVEALRSQGERRSWLPRSVPAADINLHDTLATLFPALKKRSIHD